MPIFLCDDCEIKLDEHDIDANLNTWGVVKGFCSDCIEHHVDG